jgi:hypothetical protein
MTAKASLALITGASSGIGLALAKQLARSGAHLILVARNSEALNNIRTELTTSHTISVRCIALDLSTTDAAAHLAEQLGPSIRDIDLLINNAGFGINDVFTCTELKTINQMIMLNITALTELTHFILPFMQLRQSGKILNVASVAAFQACPYFAVYGATKAFVLSFSNALGIELKGSGISVTTLCPGATATNFHSVAGSTNGLGLKFSDPAEAVAKQALAAVYQEKMYVITGTMNKIIPWCSRILPRAWVVSIAGRLFNKARNARSVTQRRKHSA